MRKVKNLILIMAFLSVIICTLIPFNVSATTYDIETEQYYNNPIIFISKGNTVTVDVDCLSDSDIDVYILKDSEYDKYMENNTFSPEIAKENIKKTNFEWKVPDSNSYYIVVDNRDNTRDTDAVPRMNVSVDINYSTNWGENLIEDAENFISNVCLMILIVIVIIAVVIILVIYLLVKKKKQPPMQPQQPYQPQQFPQQQQYQPPQQQQFQQQPYQQPPQQYQTPPQQQFQPQPNAEPPQYQQPPQQTQMCQTCGGGLRFIQEYNAWYCDKCQKYG